MSNRKYIHLQKRILLGSNVAGYFLNGKILSLATDHGFFLTLFEHGNLNQGSKNLALAICKELYPGHENDLHEKFLKDYIGKLKDSDIVEVSLDITEFCQYARDVIRIKQEAGVESIEDCLPF